MSIAGHYMNVLPNFKYSIVITRLFFTLIILRGQNKVNFLSLQIYRFRFLYKSRSQLCLKFVQI